MEAHPLLTSAREFHLNNPFLKSSRLLLLFAVIAFSVVGGCKKSTTEPAGPKLVRTQDDADAVATIILWQALEPAQHNTSTTWDSTTVNGSVAGSAVVNGWSKEVWSGVPTDARIQVYNLVQMSYSGYCSISSFPTISGSGAINGTITVHSSTSGTSYGGEWDFTATVQLSGERCSDQTWAYTDKVTCTVKFSTPWMYTGWITRGTRSWNVSGTAYSSSFYR